MDINSTITSGNFTQNVNNAPRPAGQNGTPPPPQHGQGQGDQVHLGENNHQPQQAGYNAHGTQGAQGHNPPPPPHGGPQGNGMQMQGAQMQQMQASPEAMNFARSQGAYASQGVNGTTPPPPSAEANKVNGDRAEFSSEGVLRQEAFNVAMATPEVRQDRVNALREQVQNGTYEINSRELANNLVRDEAAFAAIS